MIRRQSVTFSGETLDKVEALATKRKIPISEIVRDAIAKEPWVDEVQDNQGQILVRRPNDNVPREVRFVR